MKQGCKHPPNRHYSGFYKANGVPTKEAIQRHMWVICLDCGEHLRTPPIIIEEEAQWAAQRA